MIKDLIVIALIIGLCLFGWTGLGTKIGVEAHAVLSSSYTLQVVADVRNLFKEAR